MKVATILLALCTIYTSNNCFAQSCSDLLGSEHTLYENNNKIIFKHTEVFRHNNNLGQQQEGDLTFIKWFEMDYQLNDFSSIIGITETGNLYHLISFHNGRTVARKLNGTTVVDDFKVSSQGRILAKDQRQVYTFSSQLWMRPSSKAAFQKWRKLWTVSAIPAVALKYILWPDIFLYKDLFSYSVPIPAIETSLIGLSAFSSAFAALYYYEHINGNPTGLTPISINFDNPLWFAESEVLKHSQNNLEHFNKPPIESLGPKLKSELSIDIENP